MIVSLHPEAGELSTAIRELLQSRPSPGGGPRVLINVAGQPANSLLHDGQAWKRYPPSRLIGDAEAALRSAARADFVVHAGFHFAGARDAGLEVADSLAATVEGALAAEQVVLQARRPACVVRLGYLYGPGSRSLRAYRRAFRIGRPYWAGPARVRQRFLHTHDAARALLAAARGVAGSVTVAADDQPATFAAFMDHFARLVGNPLPLHIPGVLAPVSHLVIAQEHMDMVRLATARIPDRPRPRGFTPRFPAYRGGLREVVHAWS